MTARRTRSPRGSGEQLRGEIIDAAARLLEEHEDADAVSVRAVADEVGVSPPSIYLHFTDKDALLDAVCGQYFDRLDEALATAMVQCDHPLDHVVALGRTYIRFAVEHPAAYRFAFGHNGTEGTPMVDEALRAAAFLRLSATVRELVDLGWFPDIEAGSVPAADTDERTMQIALELWIVAHGAASLMIAKPELPWGDELDLAESVMRAVLVGRGLVPLTGARVVGEQMARFVDGRRAATPDWADDAGRRE
ncbi:TetR/AcrR family transcriptional regulator [Gordonia sp. X0973]|uniref:TetR/AcrR family transcriptional regulator n=1 Tax=Gordonia sp. X0973 TaxID=2742602 RepID=UPI000F530CEB|nr:TetR/AcrR family transcriptional regulator [Gordonia sp. X0973]